MKKLVYLAGGFYLSRVRSDMSDVLAHLRNLEIYPKTIFDVGVANGTQDMYMAFPKSHFILIEPLLEFEADMMQMKKAYHLDYIIAGASDSEGMLKFNVHPDLAGSSMLKEVEGAHVDGDERIVPSIRLDKLAADRQLSPPYMIKVDVQGGELKVLSGAEGILDATEAIILEVSLFGFFVDGPQFADIIAAMKQYSFVVYEIFDARTRPLDGALAQVDILFVREDGPLRKQHKYATEEQRSAQNKKIRSMLKQ
ncbi:MAG: FkbM family methyltransferase [Gammaproteobacteria bacterium]|nr:FkbM family methyltransferase [Gammaproteobacteria bacterium]